MDTIEERIQARLDTYADALAGEDLATIAASYVLPALVVTDSGAIPVTQQADIETAFTDGAAQYRARGLVDTRPAVLSTQPLSDQLVWVDVLWALRDAERRVRAHERMAYLLRLDDTTARIQVVVPRPVPAPLPTVE